MRTKIQEKRQYIKHFFERFTSDSKFNTSASKAFGPWSALLTFEDEFDPSDDILIGDMYFDLGMNPSKALFYNESRIERMYSALKMVELNQSIRVLGYFAYAIVQVKNFFTS